MDRNSIIGLVLIAVIMFTWMYTNQPTKEEVEKKKRAHDSLAAVREADFKNAKTLKLDSVVKSVANESAAADTFSASAKDSLQNIMKIQKYGEFSNAVSGVNQCVTIENEKIKATLCTKGGRISSLQLKGYKTYKNDSLLLFTADSSAFGILFDTETGRTFNTNDFYFFPEGASAVARGDETKKISMRLYAGTKDKYIEYEYSLKGNGYLLGCKINLVNMNGIIAGNAAELGLNWKMKTTSHEKNAENERKASTAYFKYMEEEPDHISESNNETKSINEAKIKWVAFRQQFFTSVLIADEHFEKTGADLTSVNEQPESKYIKSFAANLSMPYSGKEKESFGMRFYFGPNHFQTLKKTGDLNLERQIPLGWGIFGWVNRFLVIPVFNFLDSFNWNYGIIILMLTIVVKIILFPIAFKTYLGSAKMRILKPEIDEIGKKFKDDPMKKQQATMVIYKKAGVNPLAGCVPVLLQMPILIALFSFFPASIELRQQGFLWADDLSTYDSVWDFGYVPVINFIYGDHVSLFSLLMVISTLIYTYTNSQLMGQNDQMPGMKYMIYIMPVMFLPIMNNYSSGLSYYYFLANMITYGQTLLMERLIDHDALHKKIEENKKRPVKVSRFQQRLEKMAKQRQQMQRRR